MDIAFHLWSDFTANAIGYLLLVAIISLLLIIPRWRIEKVLLQNTMRLFVAGFAVQLLGALLMVAGAEVAGDVVQDMGWLVSGVAVIRLVGLALFRVLLPKCGVSPPRILEDISVTVGYIGWGLLQLRLAGVDPSSLVTTSAVITAIIAFSMQDTLGNVLGGLFLELDDSLSIGDWVRIDDVSGRVEQIRWRHTAIRTRNGELVIVPNSNLMRTRFTVLGNPDTDVTRWRRWIWFDVVPTASPGTVIAVAENLFAGTDMANLAPARSPDCMLMEMSHGYLRFALRYWLHDPALDDPTDTAVRVHLYAALQRAGLQLASPETVVRNIHETRHHNATVEAKDVARRRAALARVSVFAGLSGSELDTLALRLVRAPFAAGDIITRQGAIAHWLYVLESGDADVYVERVPGMRHHVASLLGGSFFGEMGLLTGEPRRATVVARTDVECYRLDKAAFESILHARPEIAEQISHDLLAREKELVDAMAVADTQLPPPEPVTSDKLMNRILNFFGLNSIE